MIIHVKDPNKYIQVPVNLSPLSNLKYFQIQNDCWSDNQDFDMVGNMASRFFICMTLPQLLINCSQMIILKDEKACAQVSVWEGVQL